MSNLTHFNSHGNVHMVDISQKRDTKRLAFASGQILMQEKTLNEIKKGTNKKGDVVTYNHDKVYEVMKSKLETLPCWEKYKSYTATSNIPMSVRNIELV